MNTLTALKRSTLGLDLYLSATASPSMETSPWITWRPLRPAERDAEAQFSIGRMYAIGEGVLKGEDEAQAVRW